MKKIVFSDHARQRIIQRDWNYETVLFALKNPDNIRRSFGKRSVLIKKLNGKTIQVVYIEKETFIKIITVY